MELVLALVAGHARQAARVGVQAAVADVALRRALHLRAHRLRPHLQRVQDGAVLRTDVTSAAAGAHGLAAAQPR